MNRLLPLVCVMLALGGCFKDIAPQGPIPDAEASLGTLVAESGASYDGPPALPFPVPPFRTWGLDFAEELLWEFGEDPVYGMVEIAEIRRRDGTNTFFALVSEHSGTQHVGVSQGADLALAAAFPAPAYDARLRVIPLRSETHMSYDVAFFLPDGRVVQAHLESRNSHAAPSERNGNAMNHSEDSVLAVLDLREMGLARATVYVDDAWVPTRVLLPFVPYAMRLVQAAGGLAAGMVRIEGDGTVASVDGASWTLEVMADGEFVELVGRDPIVDHVFRFRALGDGVSGPLELVSASVKHGAIDVFSARFNPPLPDLRWRHDDPRSSRMVAGAHGREDYLVGEVRSAPSEGGMTVDVLPEAPGWACERPVRTTVTVRAGAVELSSSVVPGLAAGGAGRDACRDGGAVPRP